MRFRSSCKRRGDPQTFYILLGGDEVDDHVDDAGAAGAGAQVHAGAPDFVLQQLVQLPAQHFHQLGHLEGKKKKKHIDSTERLSRVRGRPFRLYVVR